MGRTHDLLVSDGLKVDRLRLIMGTSQGGGPAFASGERWPRS